MRIRCFGFRERARRSEALIRELFDRFIGCAGLPTRLRYSRACTGVEVSKVTRLNQGTSATRISFCEAAQRRGQCSEPGAMSINLHFRKLPNIIGNASADSSLSGCDQPSLEFGEKATKIR